MENTVYMILKKTKYRIVNKDVENVLGFTRVLAISGSLVNLKNHLRYAMFSPFPFNPTYMPTI